MLLTAPLWVPLFLLIACVILIADGRPILHRAARVGAGGRDIHVLKFRTMRANADAELGSLLAADPALAEEFRATFKLKNDPRVTRVGAVLRRLSLDELPQLLNVLSGEMSLVGPRPVVRPELEQYYGVHGPAILSVRPGLTGLWQVSGRSLLSYDDRIRLDLEYVRGVGLFSDLWILVCTVPSVFRGHGAF